MEMSWGCVASAIGILIIVISIIGYVADVYPFHLHPDYSKDPCVGGEVHCMRVNPEFNTIPLCIGVMLIAAGGGLKQFKEATKP